GGGHAAGHVEADHEHALRADLAHRLLDGAAHQRARPHEHAGPRARGRRAPPRRGSASVCSPTSGMVSTEMCSPRMLWRSASEMAPSATWPTCAPPPMMMIRLPNTVWKVC